MATRYLPLSLRHSPTPKIEDFALLAGLEAAVRGTLISSMPLTVYAALGSAAATSRVYFIAGIVSLIWGLLVPSLTRILPRRWTYSLGCCLYLCGMTLAIIGTPASIALSLICNAMATVTVFVCFNAYVLDYIDRADLSRGQSTQMVYAATSWTVGPLLGVSLHAWWAPAPFILAGFWAMCLLTAFWFLRLGNGKQIARAKTAALNPLAYLMPFFQQRRLIAGWLFAVVRSCGWWVYVVYLPIFCIEAGLGNKVGGIALSTSNALLFVAPVISRAVKRHSVRRMVRMAFGVCGVLFAIATVVSPLPWLTVAAVMCASMFLVTLDVVGGLPFMMAVKPSQRTEMAAVYSTFRDVSGIATPGAAYLVLLVAPLPGIFAACAVAMGAAFLVAGRLHPRLGAPKPVRA